LASTKIDFVMNQQQNALSPLVFNFVLEYAIKEVKERVK
jgi:hypothetical protein